MVEWRVGHDEVDEVRAQVVERNQCRRGFAADDLDAGLEVVELDITFGKRETLGVDICPKLVVVWLDRQNRRTNQCRRSTIVAERIRAVGRYS